MKRFTFLLISMMCVMLALAGCFEKTITEDPRIKLLAMDLDTIEAVRLEDSSLSEPVTIEQATEHILKQVTEPNIVVAMVELTLKEVRASALANNLDLKVNLIDPSIEQTYLDQERAKFEAVFYNSAQYNSTESLTGGGTTSSQSYDVGVEAPLVTGGSLGIGMPFSDSSSGGVADAAVSVSFIQSLLRGAGTRINTHSIRIASYGKHMTDASTKLQAIQILTNADIAYWRLYTAHKELDVRKEQYKLAKNQLEHARRKVASRSAARIEIVRAEAWLSGSQEDVITAETALRDRERDIKIIMNRKDIPPNSPIEIVVKTAPNPLGLKLDEKVMAAAAIKNRMDMVMLELRLAINELDIEMAENSTLPDVILAYSYSARNQSSTIGRALGGLPGDSANSHSVGLSSVIPIGNEVSQARLRRAKLNRLKNLANREQLKQIIEKEVYQAVNELRQNWRRILAAAQGVTAAYRDYQVEQSQFQLGKRNSTDVLLATGRLADAQLRKIRAFAEYEIAQVNLARATGTLLGHGRIELEPVELSLLQE